MNAIAKPSRHTSTSRPNQTQRVRIEYHNPLAQSVFLAGTFNDWNPRITEMLRLEDGRWAKELALIPGVYGYRFIVDGHWTQDPAAREFSPNGLGERNSVLQVAVPERGNHL